MLHTLNSALHNIDGESLIVASASSDVSDSIKKKAGSQPSEKSVASTEKFDIRSEDAVTISQQLARTDQPSDIPRPHITGANIDLESKTKQAASIA